MLTDAFPSLLHTSPGEIQEPGLPELRNLVVLDDKGEFFGTQRQKERLGTKSAVDWREVIMWREDGKEKGMQGEIGKTLHKGEVMNLQFTRRVSQQLYF
jgi:hypothetical protein